MAQVENPKSFQTAIVIVLILIAMLGVGYLIATLTM
jgi:hypothetical protein